jgi:hypothetical protein
MARKNFTIFWFSPRMRRLVRPQVHVEVGGGFKIPGQTMVAEMDSNLPHWFSKYETRRGLAFVVFLALLSIWSVSLSVESLSLIQNLVMALFLLVFLGLLNFSFRSLFDVSSDVLDERLYQLRNHYAYLSYQVAGGYLILSLIAVSFLGIDASNLWLPFIASYAAIPYVLLGWKERNFS